LLSLSLSLSHTHTHSLSILYHHHFTPVSLFQNLLQLGYRVRPASLRQPHTVGDDWRENCGLCGPVKGEEKYKEIKSGGEICLPKYWHFRLSSLFGNAQCSISE